MKAWCKEGGRSGEKSGGEMWSDNVTDAGAAKWIWILWKRKGKQWKMKHWKETDTCAKKSSMPETHAKYQTRHSKKCRRREENTLNKTTHNHLCESSLSKMWRRIFPRKTHSETGERKRTRKEFDGLEPSEQKKERWCALALNLTPQWEVSCDWVWAGRRAYTLTCYSFLRNGQQQINLKAEVVSKSCMRSK